MNLSDLQLICCDTRRELLSITERMENLWADALLESYNEGKKKSEYVIRRERRIEKRLYEIYSHLEASRTQLRKLSEILPK